MALSMSASRGLFPSPSHSHSHSHDMAPRMPLPPPCATRSRKISGRRLGVGLVHAPLPSLMPSLSALLCPITSTSTSTHTRPPVSPLSSLSPQSPLSPSLSDWDIELDERAARRRTISLPMHGRKANPALAPAVPSAKWRPWGTIDAQAFPHILDGVIAAADYRGLLALRGVNRAWRARVDAMLFEHVALITPAAGPRQVDRGVHARVRASLRKWGYTGAVLLAPRLPIRLLPCLPGRVPTSAAAIRVLDTYDYTEAESELFDALASDPDPPLFALPTVGAVLPGGRGLAVSRSATLMNGSFPTPGPTVHAPTAVHYLPAVGLHRVTITVDVGTSRVILRIVPAFVSPFATECDTWLLETTGPCDVVFVFDPAAFTSAPNVADLKYNLAAGLAESFELLDTVGVPLPNVTLVGLDELTPPEEGQPETESDVAFVQRFVAERVGDEVDAYVNGMTMDQWEACRGPEAALERATLPFAAQPFDEE